MIVENKLLKEDIEVEKNKSKLLEAELCGESQDVRGQSTKPLRNVAQSVEENTARHAMIQSAARVVWQKWDNRVKDNYFHKGDFCCLDYINLCFIIIAILLQYFIIGGLVYFKRYDVAIACGIISFVGHVCIYYACVRK